MNVTITHHPERNAIRGLFHHDGKWFVADLCRLRIVDDEDLAWTIDLYGSPNECMVFLSDAEGHIDNYTEYYESHPQEVSEKALMDCIEDFCSQGNIELR